MEFAFAKHPPSQSTRRLDFEKVKVVPGFVNNTFFLIVAGQKPCINMKVSLAPLIYVQCPEYWGIEVIGNLPNGICLDQVGSYQVAIPLSGITGSAGIEVFGATKSEKINVSGGCHAGASFQKDGPFPEK